jgi:hypothetical protein
MKRLLTIVILIFVKASVFAQDSDSILKVIGTEYGDFYGKLSYSLTNNKDWADTYQTVTFESQGRLYSCYLCFNADSSYLFFSVFEGGMLLSVGTWTTLQNDTILLFWNKNKTVFSCTHESISEKYYQYAYPMPLPIVHWRFIRIKKLLKPIV